MEKKLDNRKLHKKTSIQIKSQTVVVALLLLIFGMIFLWIGLTSNVEDARFDSETPCEMQGVFDVTYGGNTIQTMLPTEIDANAGDLIVISKVLTEEEIMGDALLLYLKQSYISVYIDDELQLKVDNAPSTPFSMSVGSRWYCLKLPPDFQGRTLKMEIIPQFDDYGKELPAIYTGTKSAFIYMILEKGAYSLIMGGLALILGIVILVSGFLIMSDRMVYLGLFAIVTSLWGILESRVTQLFTGNLQLSALVLFSNFYLIPVLVMAFLLTYKTLYQRKYMHWMFWLSAASFVVVQLLQIAGIFYYIQLVYIVHVLVVLILLGVIKSYIDIKRSKAEEQEEELSIYRAILMLGVFGVAEIISYYVYPRGGVGKYVKAGLLVFIAYLGYSVVKQLRELEWQRAKTELYKELAFKDIMTELANRTSFEQDMHDLREEDAIQKDGNESQRIVFITDMNGLKSINDNFGHAMGDEAIIKTGYILQQHFTKGCSCYRIGGDEFCVIARGITQNEFEEMCRSFERAIERCNTQTKYPLSVSIGYSLVDESGIDACLKKADELMYTAKADYKKSMNLG